MKKLSLIIPAHNEEDRIGATLRDYAVYFDNKQSLGELAYELVVVLNGCTDATAEIVRTFQENYAAISMVETEQAGKGLAIKLGFQDALQRDADFIGFVDADMATLPEYFYDLVVNVATHDGIIASRYMPGACITPARPLIKRWGSRLVYESLIKLLFGISYYDYQCGAKVFTRKTVERMVPHITVRQWAFDVELLYISKKLGCSVKELPTVWYDRAGSKLRLSAGYTMLTALFKVRFHHSFFNRKRLK